MSKLLTDRVLKSLPHTSHLGVSSLTITHFPIHNDPTSALSTAPHPSFHSPDTHWPSSQNSRWMVPPYLPPPSSELLSLPYPLPHFSLLQNELGPTENQPWSLSAPPYIKWQQLYYQVWVFLWLTSFPSLSATRLVVESEHTITRLGPTSSSHPNPHTSNLLFMITIFQAVVTSFHSHNYG